MKILLADDEPLELLSLKKLLEDIEEFDLVYAENGLEAINQLESNDVDLAFLDIQMPGLNGLDVLKEIQVKWPKTIVSIVSAFSEFKYAKQALELGAICYLLKPFSVDEFNRTLLKMKIEYKKQLNLNYFVIQSIIERDIFGEGVVSYDEKFKHFSFSPEIVLLLKKSEFDSKEQLKRDLSVYNVLFAPQPIGDFQVLLTNNDHLEAVKEILVQSNLESSQQILFGIGKGNTIKVAYSNALKDYYDQNKTVFTQFMNYMQENYNKDLTVSKVAKSVHVSASHLNRLLKKEYGMTFTEILLNVRINKAKELLLKNYNVEIVSDMVGFNSSAYFSVCFKKLTGVSPSHFKKEIG